jgi:hypothetical protein
LPIRIGDDLLTGREYFRPFNRPDAHFFWCCRRATQLKLYFSGFPNLMAHFQIIGMRSCREVKV